MFSANQKQTSATSAKITSSPKSVSTSPKLSVYGDILLRTYIEIAESGNLELLILSGEHTAEELADAWEAIVKENSTKSGDRQYEHYFELIQDYTALIAKQTVVISCLDLLSICTMDFTRLARMLDVLETVREHGYKIETGDLMKFAKGIAYCKKKATNLITQLERKKKEIERQYPVKDPDKSRVNYQEILGHLEVALDRTVMDGENITLAKYNVLRQSVEAKRKAQEAANAKRGG